MKYKNINFEMEHPVLDIGGGSGKFLLSQGVRKATIVGITKEEIADNRVDFNFINHDLKKGLKLNKKYKTIFLMEVLEHLPNPLYLLADAYDLLDDDGRIYLSVPWTRNYNFGYSPRYRRGLGRHLQRWKLSELVKEVTRLGFKVKIIQTKRRYKGFGFWLPHSWIVLRLVKNKGLLKDD